MHPTLNLHRDICTFHGSRKMYHSTSDHRLEHLHIRKGIQVKAHGGRSAGTLGVVY